MARRKTTQDDVSKGERLRKRLARFGLGTLVLVMLGLALGAIMENWQVRRLTEHYQPPGRMIDIGSHELHMYCQGTGSPPILLSAGSGLAYSNWSAIQSGLRSVTTVCSYDRSGLGWSQPGPLEPSANHATDELARLLSASGIPGPWIMVGHSLGGLYAQQFMNRYPENVAGLVLLDSAHEDQYEITTLYLDEATPSEWDLALPYLSFVGVHRLGRPSVPETDPSWVARQLHATPKHFHTAEAEWWSLPFSARQVRAAKADWGDVPVVVLEAGRRVWPEHWSEQERVETTRLLIGMQQELASRSSRGRYELIEESGHGIPWEHPDTVIAAVESIVQELRKPAG